MSCRYTVLMLLATVTTMLLLLAADDPASAEAYQASQSRAIDDPNDFIEAQMRAHWASPERRTWRIHYRSIVGLNDRASWHIEGTMWWVRFYPEVFKLDELDTKSVYEIDAVALNQNYGVIDFYLYDFPKVSE